MGSKKPLILQGFWPFDACEPTRPKLDSDHRYEGDGRRGDIHRKPANGFAPPSFPSINPACPPHPKDRGYGRATSQGSGSAALAPEAPESSMASHPPRRLPQAARRGFSHFHHYIFSQPIRPHGRHFLYKMMSVVENRWVEPTTRSEIPSHERSGPTRTTDSFGN